MNRNFCCEKILWEVERWRHLKISSGDYYQLKTVIEGFEFFKLPKPSHLTQKMAYLEEEEENEEDENSDMSISSE